MYCRSRTKTSTRVHTTSPFVHWGGAWLTEELNCWVGTALTTRRDGNDLSHRCVLFVSDVAYRPDACLCVYRSVFRKIPTSVIPSAPWAKWQLWFILWSYFDLYKTFAQAYRYKIHTMPSHPSMYFWFHHTGLDTIMGDNCRLIKWQAKATRSDRGKKKKKTFSHNLFQFICSTFHTTNINILSQAHNVSNAHEISLMSLLHGNRTQGNTVFIPLHFGRSFICIHLQVFFSSADIFCIAV